MDVTEAESTDDAPAKKKFNIDLSVIESVQKEDQDLELQSLGLSVFDQSALEKGVIQQYSKALTGDSDHFLKEDDSCNFSEKEEGEIDNEDLSTVVTSHDEQSVVSELNHSDASNSVSDPVSKIEEYLRKQLKLQEIRKLQTEAKKTTNTVTSIFKKKKCSVTPIKKSEKYEKSDTSNKKKSKHSETKKEQKSKYLGPSKKKKKNKEKLGTRKGQSSVVAGPSLQPGEENYFYNNTSGSEYVPSDENSISSDGEFELKPKPKKKATLPKKRKSKKDNFFYDSPATDDSDWDSDSELLKKKGPKELDDGNMDYFCHRIKENERTSTSGIHVIEDDFVIPKDIWEKLYEYQRKTVHWFWSLNRQISGGILGDEMGLGKTIQVIAYLAALHRSELRDQFTRHEGLGPTLIVCPTTVMHQWVREFHKWYPPIRVAILHESGTYSGKDRSKLVHSIHATSTKGVLVTSYNGLVQYRDTIVPKEWHYVILDEGHKIRNSKAKVTEVAKELDTPHRIILSGSPLQNNLQELWCLFDFICPGKLGTVQTFTETFAIPIMQGGYANASQTQVVTAHKCATILKDTITPFLLRRMKEDVGCHINLPDKKEQVLFCRLTDEQRELYKEYLDKVDLEEMVRGRAKLFVALINLRKICNHPDLYSGGPNRNFRISPGEGPPAENHFGYWERAGKMIVIQTILKIWNQQGHRVLLFTQSKKMLLIMEDFVKRSNYKYLKLDGQTSVGSRQPLIDKFNKDTTYFIMLLTTKVGGLGVNLTGANRVIIYDPDWNPATDTQARERAWRIGQERDVTIYRLITAGTIEEKIYHRQIFKQFLSNKVLKDPKQRRFFKSNDLLELFTLSETVKNGTTETAAIFAGTGSEIRKSDVKKVTVNKNVSFSQSKIDQMKKLAQELSKKISGMSNNETKSSLKPKDECNKNIRSNTSEDQINPSDSLYGADGMINIHSARQVMSTSVSLNTNESSVTPSSTGRDVVESDSVSHLKTDSPLDSVQASSLKNDFSVSAHGSKLEPPPLDLVQASSSKKESAQDLLPSKEAETDSVPAGKSNNIKSETEENNNVKIKHSKSKRKHKESFAKFEGQEVPHLVKKRRFKKPSEQEEKEKYISQDDYVLKKLFSKGIETAMKHDTIMDGGPSDYAIVEAEAERVAQDALKALRESQERVQRFNPLVRRRRQTTGSNDLIAIIKKRNMILEAGQSEKTLLSDMISYLQSQGGTTSTEQLVQEFRPKVGEGKNPLFKTFLDKIAKFYRGPDKVGYWTIREEFNRQPP